MIIKEPQEQELVRVIFSNFLSRFKRHRLIFFCAAFLLTFGLVIFFIVTLYKTGFVDRLKRHISVKSISIPLNYIKGFLARPEHIAIDIKFEDYEKLAYNRSIAIQRRMLLPDYRDEVPALIRYNNETFRIKLRLKGHFEDHWRGDRWSFRIRLRGDNTIFGMKKFSIQHPGTRVGMNEWYYKQLLRDNGLIAQRYDFIDVTINGKKKGIYALEEHFGKRLIENNHLREGPILHFDDTYLWQAIDQSRTVGTNAEEAYWAADIGAFSSKRTREKPVLRHAFLKGRELLESLRSGKLPAHKVFDVRKSAKLFAISELCGSLHAHEYVNVRFYYNPVTSLLEPIGSDVGYFEPIDHLAGSAEKDRRENIFATWEKHLFSDPVFFREYIRSLEEISDRSFLDNFFEDTAQEARQKLLILYRSYPWYRFDGKKILYQNQRMIRHLLNPVRGLKAYFKKKGRTQNSYYLEIGNAQTMPIEVLGIRYKKMTILPPIKKIVIPGKPVSHPIEYGKIGFRIPEQSLPPDISLTDIKVAYRIPGSSIMRYESVSPRPSSFDTLPVDDLIRQDATIGEFDFLSVDEDAKKIFFKKGEWELQRNLIVPAGYTLIAGEGVRLHLSGAATILSYSPVLLTGTESDPVIIDSPEATGGGIVVMNAGKRSILNNVIISNLSNPSQDGWELTGAVTFYESPVTLTGTFFSQNKAGDDCLNIIRSDFTIKETVFSDTFADALDVDFSSGSIDDCRFIQCGNDAIDVSGSSLAINAVDIEKVGDKGISVGEESTVSARVVSIAQASIAAASKDSSELTLHTIKLSHCDVGLAAYQKKPEFGPGSIVAAGVIEDTVGTSYVVEKGSTIRINGNNVVSDKKEDKELLQEITQR